MTYFPIFIDIEHKKCMIIGGGKVALRKAETLLRYRADVRVIGEEVCEELRALLPPGKIREGKAAEADIENAALVIAATGDRETNHWAAEICRDRKIPVNVADAPEECTFLFPAVVKKGDISVGINTGGKSPVVSSRIRKKVEEDIPDYYGEIAGQLGELREYVRKSFQREADRRKILKQAAAEAFCKERILSPGEIDNIIRQVKENGAFGGRSVGY